MAHQQKTGHFCCINDKQKSNKDIHKKCKLQVIKPLQTFLCQIPPGNEKWQPRLMGEKDTITLHKCVSYLNTYINASIELGHTDECPSYSRVPHAMKVCRRQWHVSATLYTQTCSHI